MPFPPARIFTPTGEAVPAFLPAVAVAADGLPEDGYITVVQTKGRPKCHNDLMNFDGHKVPANEPRLLVVESFARRNTAGRRIQHSFCADACHFRMDHVCAALEGHQHKAEVFMANHRTPAMDQAHGALHLDPHDHDLVIDALRDACTHKLEAGRQNRAGWNGHATHLSVTGHNLGPRHGPLPPAIALRQALPTFDVLNNEKGTINTVLLDVFIFDAAGLDCRIVGGCTCEDFAYRGKYKQACKHLLHVVRWLGNDGHRHDVPVFPNMCSMAQYQRILTHRLYN